MSAQMLRQDKLLVQGGVGTQQIDFPDPELTLSKSRSAKAALRCRVDDKQS